MFTLEEIDALFDVDVEKGEVRREKPWGTRPPGSLVTNHTGITYSRIYAEGRRVRIHQIIWAKAYGVWPDHPIDHINGEGLDNRIANLRKCTNAENFWNQKQGKRKRAKYGKWVMYETLPSKTLRFRGQVRANGKTYKTRSFDNPEEARVASALLAKELHGEFFCADR